MMNQIIAPSIPVGVEQDHRFVVQVRPIGSTEWTPVPTYAAWVDMHEVRQTAVGIFDFDSPVEVCVQPDGF